MITFDVTGVDRASRLFDGYQKQFTFALSKTLNEGIKAARRELSEDTWPQAINVKNKAFAKFALRPKFSTKADLTAELSDAHMGDRAGILSGLSHGGRRTAKRGAMAVPSAEIAARRTGKGVPRSLRPKALPNTFRKGDVIYQRVGKGGRRLKLRYVLKKTTPVPKKVRMEAAFETVVRREVNRQFPIQLKEALRTARR